MGYDKEKKPYTDTLCLYGGLAKDFMRTPPGETVKLTVTAVLTSASLRPPDDVEGADTPYVEFEIMDVDGGKKAYGDMSDAEMEAEIYNVNNEEQPERQSTVPNREDGGSVWTDYKRQEKVSRQPMRRPRPFRMG